MFSAYSHYVLAHLKTRLILKLSFQHPTDPNYIPDVTPFTPMWGQEAPPPMVSYPELMAGFPCGDLGK